jgi:deoxyribose-phosphate aldolase
MDVARLIDHTLLRADATRAEVEQVCTEAMEYSFASVCVNAFWVPYVAGRLKGSAVKVCTVVGFPLGATSTAAKVAETTAAIGEGAQEVDMVLNVGALKSGMRDEVEADILAVAKAAHQHGAILKVILETCLLDEAEKEAACRMAVAAGADYVKTSTGFSKSGATVEDIALMRRTVGPRVGVKASGGIRTYADAVRMIEAGASRIGASASVAIAQGGSAVAGSY